MLHLIGHNSKLPYFCTGCKTGVCKPTRVCKGRKGQKCIDMNDFPRDCRACNESVVSHPAYILHYFRLHLEHGVPEFAQTTDRSARGKSLSIQSGSRNLEPQSLEHAWDVDHGLSPSFSPEQYRFPLLIVTFNETDLILVRELDQPLKLHKR